MSLFKILLLLIVLTSTQSFAGTTCENLFASNSGLTLDSRLSTPYKIIMKRLDDKLNQISSQVTAQEKINLEKHNKLEIDPESKSVDLEKAVLAMFVMQAIPTLSMPEAVLITDFKVNLKMSLDQAVTVVRDLKNKSDIPEPLIEITSLRAKEEILTLMLKSRRWTGFENQQIDQWLKITFKADRVQFEEYMDNKLESNSQNTFKSSEESLLEEYLYKPMDRYFKSR